MIIWLSTLFMILWSSSWSLNSVWGCRYVRDAKMLSRLFIGGGLHTFIILSLPDNYLVLSAFATSVCVLRNIFLWRDYQIETVWVACLLLVLIYKLWDSLTIVSFTNSVLRTCWIFLFLLVFAWRKQIYLLTCSALLLWLHDHGYSFVLYWVIDKWILKFNFCSSDWFL